MDFYRPLVLVAALFGAAGVALAALGSHTGAPNIAIAASFLQLHAAALLGMSFLPPGRLFRLGPWVLVVGTLLFAGDLVARSQLGSALFPMAAPLGGGAMILGWLLVAAGAVFTRRG
jgi:uncharacterized membrane protein YgdD (TMEM256/DUF423 family)